MKMQQALEWPKMEMFRSWHAIRVQHVTINFSMRYMAGSALPVEEQEYGIVSIGEHASHMVQGCIPLQISKANAGSATTMVDSHQQNSVQWPGGQRQRVCDIISYVDRRIVLPLVTRAPHVYHKTALLEHVHHLFIARNCTNFDCTIYIEITQYSYLKSDMMFNDFCGEEFSDTRSNSRAFRAWSNTCWKQICDIWQHL